MMIAITTSDNLTHYLDNVGAIADIPSPNTRSALQTAYDRGHWKAYIPPESTTRTAQANWDAFNSQIMANPRLNAVMGAVLAISPAIALGLPSALAQVSTQGSSAFQITFEALCQIGGATEGDRASWAELAIASHLPAEFIAIVRGNAE